jgi:ABC-type anion transport system duplicated permease subunit
MILALVFMAIMWVSLLAMFAAALFILYYAAIWWGWKYLPENMERVFGPRVRDIHISSDHDWRDEL